MKITLVLSLFLILADRSWAGAICYFDKNDRRICLEEEVSSSSAQATSTGVPLNRDWKKKVYNFAQKYVIHPAWGVAHSERNYQTSSMLAHSQGMEIDLDVLFAAAFLHDLGGIGQFQKAGVDHAVRSAELAGGILESAGFPMEKLPQVKEMILGHTYYGPKPPGKAALLFRDADILDFLGIIGLTRVLAITEEPDRKLTLSSTVQLIGKFKKELPPLLSTPAARTAAMKRVSEMDLYILTLGPYTFYGKAL